MFLKTTASIEKQGDVRFINGIVAFKSVKLNVCCFEVDGVLIDTGSQSLLKEFKHFFDDIDVDKAIITHYHEDHTGGAAYLQKEYKLPIYMNEMKISNCANKADYPFYRRLFWGKRAPFQAERIGQTFSSRNASWDVIKTPGHSEDHLSFLNNETGQLFTGDLYVHPRTKLVLRNESIQSIVNSLKTLLNNDFNEVFCCHAGYVKDGRSALTNKLNYLEDLQNQVISLHNQGLSAKQIDDKVFKRKYPITYFSLGEWSSLNIINSIIKEWQAK